MKSIKEILSEKNFDRARYNKYEFQAYGNFLSEELSDPDHRSLYIKYAKTENRVLLEKAREFVKSAGKLKRGSKARLFMWKLAELKKEKKMKRQEEG